MKKKTLKSNHKFSNLKLKSKISPPLSGKYIPQLSIIKDKETILASFWQRASAFSIDILFIGTIYVIIANILPLFGLHLINFDVKGIRDIQISGRGWSTKIIVALPTFYFTFLNYFTNGKTIGKWIMRIRVVSIYHHRISFWHCFERALGYAAAGVEIGLGFLQIFWTTNRMCLQDQIAETIVIQEKPIKKKLKHSHIPMKPGTGGLPHPFPIPVIEI
jgi:uncharacterized RDD family membrane protein YckC